MIINFRTLHFGDFQFDDVDRNATISSLKERIATRFPNEFPVARQRLIHKGRALIGEETLSQLSIGDGMIIHVVSRPENSVTPIPGISAPTPATPPMRGPPSQSLLDLNNAISRLFSTGNNGSSIPTGNVQGQTDSPPLEPLFQGLLTLNTLLSTITTEEPSPTQLITGELPFQDIEYFEGQWVDCRDTVNNWLEATVLRVNREDRTILVTYHGWPERWNEWINFTSNRIAPFRTHTRHLTSNYASPSIIGTIANAPTVARPTNSNDPSVLIIDLAQMMRRIQLLLDEASPAVAEQHDNLHRINVVRSQLCPLLDRLGRILIDTSSQLRVPNGLPTNGPGDSSFFRQPINAPSADPFGYPSTNVDLHISIVPYTHLTAPGAPQSARDRYSTSIDVHNNESERIGLGFSDTTGTTSSHPSTLAIDRGELRPGSEARDELPPLLDLQSNGPESPSTTGAAASQVIPHSRESRTLRSSGNRRQCTIG